MTKFFNTRVLTAALVAGVALTAAAGANAAPVTYDPDANSAIVSTADLNLASQGDAKALLARLNAAAKAVCGIEPATYDLSMHRIYETCVSSAYDNGVAQANNAMVTALSTGKAGAITVADRR